MLASSAGALAPPEPLPSRRLFGINDVMIQHGKARPARAARPRFVTLARRLALALGASILLSACGTMNPNFVVDSNEPLYASLYNYYAEICAVSQIKKKPGFGAEIRGGIGGHAVLYLNGVCRDTDAHYPTIALCDPAKPVADRGVGLSVNAHYKNTNWVATEGRDFFFNGDLAPNERLTRAAYARTQARAQAMGILDGVEFHESVFDDLPPGMSRPDFMYEMSIATDYAIGFGRGRYCARVPLDRTKMAKVVQYLNNLNVDYKSGAKSFEWNVVQNSCSHVNHNALAAAGLWDAWETNQFILFAAFDFPVPKNEFVNLMRRTNDLELDRLRDLYDDAAIRQTLVQEGWMAMQPGSLAEVRPVIQDNDVYETNLGIIFYDEGFLGVYQKRFDKILSEPRYFDLQANLQYFSRLYERLSAARKPLDSYLDDRTGATAAEQARFREFYTRFYRYLDDERAKIRAMLVSVRAAAPPPTTAPGPPNAGDTAPHS